VIPQTNNKLWNDLMSIAAPLVNHLMQPSYFGKKYCGPMEGKLILTDAKTAINYATDDSFDHFDEWETVSDSLGVFPADFQWKSWIDYHVLEKDFFALTSKDFHGADLKWNLSEACLIQELMYRDIEILLHCYANNHFPPIWQDILEVYLNDGFPCGWHGRYPDGELVVFSNY
jgi:hypothetical protein